MNLQDRDIRIIQELYIHLRCNPNPRQSVKSLMGIAVARSRLSLRLSCCYSPIFCLVLLFSWASGFSEPHTTLGITQTLPDSLEAHGVAVMTSKKLYRQRHVVAPCAPLGISFCATEHLDLQTSCFLEPYLTLGRAV